MSLLIRTSGVVGECTHRTQTDQHAQNPIPPSVRFAHSSHLGSRSPINQRQPLIDSDTLFAMARNVKARRTYNGALRREQAQMTRGRILDAARRLLVNGTYSSVTMEDIASEAGVAYQTVYGIFGSKLR